MKKYYLILAINFCLFCYGYSDISVSHSGYTNLYAINRISNGSVIKLPFRLLSYDLNIDYMNFSFKTKWGLEHKVKSFDVSQPFHNLMYDLISPDNVDYTSVFREFYLSYFPSFGEIKIGKQIHAWGATDISSPIDILNPIDYYYLFTDVDETKIGRNSFVMDLYFDPIKIELLIMPNHIANNIPNNDPDFPITLPANVQDYQFLDTDNPIEYGGYFQYSMDNMDWSAYYFSGYDRNFNLYGSNAFFNATNTVTVTDTILSYRKTQMYAFSNVSFLEDLTLRADVAYFKTDAGNQSIENRLYSGKNVFTEAGVEFPEYFASKYFNISGQYYQYSLQLEYLLPFDIDFSSQIFGYEKIKVEGDVIDVSLTNFEYYLDGKDFFYPGMGSSMATIAKNGWLINFNKTILDDTMEFQFSNLLDTKDKGNLFQFKWTYNIIDNCSLSFLYYKGTGNYKKYPDITFVDSNNDGINDDLLNNETGTVTTDFNLDGLPDGDGILDADMIDDSMLYPFNPMEQFSHIRIQLQYFF